MSPSVPHPAVPDSVGLPDGSPPADAAHLAAMPHPSRFLFLVIPFGFTAGFVGIPVAYELGQRGVSTVAIATLIALSYLPQSWKFLWAPLVDTTLTRRRWYIGSTVASGLGTLLTGWYTDMNPAPMALLTALVVLASFASTLIGMSIESMMAGTVPDSHRGRVAGWYQAGNLGGTNIGGGFGLWLMQNGHWSATAAGGLLCILGVACCLALWRMPDPPSSDRVHESLLAHARDVGRDLWGVVRSRMGILAITVCFLPIGTGAAANLWPVVAGDWHAGPDIVALVNGALSGLVMAAGCFAGGWLCDRMDRKAGYCLFGIVQLGCGIAMAVSARNPVQFILWTTLYAFTQGLTYAGFSAVVLEAIGRTAAATKYSLLAGLSNMPIAYVTLIDGHANERWGTQGMLFAEAAVGIAGVLVFVAVATASRRVAARRDLAAATSAP